MLSGSYGNASARPSAIQSIVRSRQSLIDRGIAQIRGSKLVLAQDHLFTSPSQAAAVLVGGSMNGREAWKNVAGKSINEIEAATVDQVQDPAGMLDNTV